MDIVQFICSFGVQQILEYASSLNTVGRGDAALYAGMPALVTGGVNTVGVIWGRVMPEFHGGRRPM